MSNSFRKVEAIDPFNDPALGEWKPDKKNTNKTILAFIRQAEINIPERYKQPWIDPVTYQKKHLWGRTVLTERKFINKQDSQVSLQRHVEPAIEGSHIEDVIP